MKYSFDNFNDDFEEEEEFSEKEKEIIKRSSMINTYRLILSNYDFSIFPNTFFWLLTEYEDRSVFDVLLDYFESTEEYEICADIKQIKDNIAKANKSRSEKRGKLIRYLLNPGHEE